MVNKVTVGVRLTPKTVEKLLAIANEKELSISEVIREIVCKYFDFVN